MGIAIFLLGCIFGMVFATQVRSWVIDHAHIAVVIPADLVSGIMGTLAFFGAFGFFALTVHVGYEVLRYKGARQLMGGMIWDKARDWKPSALLITAGGLCWFFFGAGSALYVSVLFLTLLLCLGYIWGRRQVMDAVGDLFYRT